MVLYLPGWRVGLAKAFYCASLGIIQLDEFNTVVKTATIADCCIYLECRRQLQINRSSRGQMFGKDNVQTAFAQYAASAVERQGRWLAGGHDGRYGTIHSVPWEAAFDHRAKRTSNPGDRVLTEGHGRVDKLLTARVAPSKGFGTALMQGFIHNIFPRAQRCARGRSTGCRGVRP